MSKKPAIWIDLENTPHVPFFVPIIRELEREGFEVILTARNFAQTRALVERAGLNAKIVGAEYGNSAFRKAIGILSRALQLAWHVNGRQIKLAVGHGSRGLLLASKLLRIPSLTLYDYEGASVRLFNKLSSHVMTPEVIPFAMLERLGLSKEKHLTYPGLKEEVYVCDFKPDTAIITELKLNISKIIITIRPPSGTAHYRNDTSFQLFEAVMALLTSRDDIRIVLMPRNVEQRSELEKRWSNTSSVIIPGKALDGLNLLYHSDLLIGGGGTMNREAAVLGVPVITIFKGPEGAVDRWLIEHGEMMTIDRANQIEPLLVKRSSNTITISTKTRDVIIRKILSSLRGTPEG